MEKQVVPQSTVRTLNRVTESAKSESAKFIAPQIGRRQAGIKKRIENAKQHLSVCGQACWQVRSHSG